MSTVKYCNHFHSFLLLCFIWKQSEREDWNWQRKKTTQSACWTVSTVRSNRCKELYALASVLLTISQMYLLFEILTTFFFLFIFSLRLFLPFSCLSLYSGDHISFAGIEPNPRGVHVCLSFSLCYAVLCMWWNIKEMTWNEMKSFFHSWDTTMAAYGTMIHFNFHTILVAYCFLYVLCCAMLASVHALSNVCRLFKWCNITPILIVVQQCVTIMIINKSCWFSKFVHENVKRYILISI